jgi:hypothetical protein
MRHPQRRSLRIARRGAVAAAVALVVAACGGGTTGAPTSAPTDAPTGAPAPAPPALAVTFTAPDGRTIRHPDGWVVREDIGFIYAATSEAASNRLVTLGSLEAGQVFIQFAENAISYGSPTSPAAHLPDNLRLLLEGSGFTAEAPVTFESAGRPAARIDAANAKLQMLAVSIKVRENLFADVIAYTAPGEMDAQAALILAMIDSLTYPPS